MHSKIPQKRHNLKSPNPEARYTNVTPIICTHNFPYTKHIKTPLSPAKNQPQSYGGIPQQGTLAELLWGSVG
jgi:hypothetical protein